jgi:heme/copper-type cytochrome/quinol oxidase subunit 3
LDVIIGAINTGILFTSGLTMSIAIDLNKMGSRFLTLFLLKEI